MSLEDDKGESLLDLTWANWSHSESYSYDIPDGQEIIGLKLRHSNYEKIQRIGIILWTPPVTVFTTPQEKAWARNAVINEKNYQI